MDLSTPSIRFRTRYCKIRLINIRPRCNLCKISATLQSLGQSPSVFKISAITINCNTRRHHSILRMRILRLIRPLITALTPPAQDLYAMDSVNCFDDSFFDCAVVNSRSAVASSPLNYVPKFHEEEWYNAIDVGETDEEQTAILKFRADRLYSTGQFEDAIENYGRVIPSLESTNLTLKRDCLEGILRALIKLGKYDDALLRIDELLKMSKSSSHLCSVWKFTAEMHRRNRDYKSEILTLHLLLNHHPLCFNLWLSLARSYSRLHDIRLSHCFDDDNEIDENVDSRDENEIDSWSHLVVVSCLIRVKIIINSVENNSQFLNFTSTRDLCVKIDRQIKKFTLPTEFLATARDCMCGDVNYEGQSDFDQLSRKDEADIPVTEPRDFEKFWFSWIDKFLPKKQLAINK